MRSIQWSLIFCYLFLNGSLAPAVEPSSSDLLKSSGTTKYRNNIPLYLFFLSMPPEKAKALATHQWEFSLDYTAANITSSAFTPVSSLYDIQIDAEVSRWEFQVNYGVYDHLEMGIEIPYLTLGSGYLDSFVENFESVFGFTTPRSRQRQGKNNYVYTLKYNKQFLIRSTTPAEGLGDIVSRLKYQLWEEETHGVNLSLRGALKFPSANENKYLGSGKWDFGSGVVVDKRLSKRWLAYFNLDYALIKSPDTLAPLDLHDYIIFSSVTAEYLLTAKSSLALNLAYHTSPYPKSQTNVLDEDALDIILGFRFHLKKNLVWRGDIQENFSASSPDVTFHTGINVVF